MGITHQDTLLTMVLLASFHEKGGEAELGQRIYKECLERFDICLEEQKVLLSSNDHPKILELMSTMAYLHSKQQHSSHQSKAKELCEYCFRRRVAILGDNHPDTLRSMRQLAIMLYKSDEYEEADSLFEQCLQKRKEFLGERHPETLESMHNLATSYCSSRRESDKSQEAKCLYDQCLTKRRESLGVNHLATLSTLNNLAVLQYKNDDQENAKTLYEEYLTKRRSLYGDYHPHPNQVHPDDIMGLLSAASFFDIDLF